MTTRRGTWLARAAIVAATVAVCAWVLTTRERAPVLPDPEPFDAIEIDGVSIPLAVLERRMSFVTGSEAVRFDPVAIVRSMPNHTWTQPWNEHPDGEIVVRTNNLGLRSDEPTGAPRGRRVLLVGDSHTYGVVDDDECLHEQLERRLEARFGEPFEVLNAAVGGIGPYEYDGNVAAWLPVLEPEAVVVVCFSGNDFSNALNYADLVAGRTAPRPPAEAAARLADVREHWSRKRCLAQGLHQAFMFKHRAEAEALAVDAAIRCFERIAARCEAAGVPLVVAVLPTKTDVEPHDEALLLDAVFAALDLTRDDDAIHRRMAEALLTALRARGVVTVDPRDAMIASDELLFWRGDHHVNHRGIAVLADELAPVLADVLAAR